MVEYMCIYNISFSQSHNVITGQYTVNVQINYSLPIEEIKQMKKETYKKADEIIQSYNLMNLDYYERIEAVNTILCDTVVYPSAKPYEEQSYTAYGALVEGSAVCDGYARAAKLLLSMCGVETLYVIGTASNGEGHAWNMVEIDSQWYQLDITWDDGSSSRLDYFLVSDEYMRQSRTWDEEKYPDTAATGYEAA